MPITRRQREILEYIRQFLTENGYSPTLEEIAVHFRVHSLNAIHKHLKGLEQRGFIRRLNKQARSIQLVQEPAIPARSTLPLLGRVAAGRPIEAVPVPEEIEVPGHFASRDANYVLQVRGDSMIEEHIQDGDYVILEHRKQAGNGEIVMALIDGETATLKKYYREGNMIRLQPANAALEALRVPEERVTVQGVLVGLMRKY